MTRFVKNVVQQFVGKLLLVPLVKLNQTKVVQFLDVVFTSLLMHQTESFYETFSGKCGRHAVSCSEKQDPLWLQYHSHGSNVLHADETENVSEMCFSLLIHFSSWVKTLKKSYVTFICESRNLLFM